jgi:hypothetical protein
MGTSPKNSQYEFSPSWYSSVTEEYQEYQDGENSYCEFIGLVPILQLATLTRSSRENPVIFILDSHSSHCILEAYNFGRENGIVIVSIPLHNSHRLHPWM